MGWGCVMKPPICSLAECPHQTISKSLPAHLHDKDDVRGYDRREPVRHHNDRHAAALDHCKGWFVVMWGSEEGKTTCRHRVPKTDQIRARHTRQYGVMHVLWSIERCTEASLSASRADVASSRSKTRGRRTSARAIAIRCFFGTFLLTGRSITTPICVHAHAIKEKQVPLTCPPLSDTPRSPHSVS